MDEIKLITWYVTITWSYDFDLLGEPNSLGKYPAKSIGWFAIESDEDLSIIMIIDAEAAEMAELIALDRLDQWFRARDMPGLTDYETEVATQAEILVQVELENIVLAEQARLNGQTG